MKLKDMTIEELRKYQKIETAKPRTDMILVKDLREWAKAKVNLLRSKLDNNDEGSMCLIHPDGRKCPDSHYCCFIYECDYEATDITAIIKFIEHAFNLEGSDG